MIACPRVRVTKEQSNEQRDAGHLQHLSFGPPVEGGSRLGGKDGAVPRLQQSGNLSGHREAADLRHRRNGDSGTSRADAGASHERQNDYLPRLSKVSPTDSDHFAHLQPLQVLSWRGATYLGPALSRSR